MADVKKQKNTKDKKTAFQKARSAISYVLLFALLFIVAFLIGSAFPVAGYQTFVVQSGSMEPAVKTGSVVVVSEQDEYEEGDIITFDTGDEMPTTHRIVDIDDVEIPAQYTTQGDANEAPDSRTVLEGQIIGKVQFSVPYAGHTVNFARQPLGFVLLIGIPAGMIISDQIRTIKKEVQEIKERKSKANKKGAGRKKKSAGKKTNVKNRTQKMLKEGKKKFLPKNRKK